MIFRKLLAPVALFYWIISGLRNFFYSIGMLPSKKFNKAVIVIGNLNTGGTGKSPHTLYILETLKENYRTGVLSRGYGRKTKGFKILNYDSTASTVGDEAMQVFNRFKNKVVVCVGEDRVSALKEMFKLFRLDVIVLDDAYQHRKLKSDFNLLLTEYSNPYNKDWPLPMGNLREPISGAKRAKSIIVTKCPPDLSVEKKIKFRDSLKLNKNQSIFFSEIVYGEYVFSTDDKILVSDLKNHNVILITGIANDKPFLKFAKNNFKETIHMDFPDHYNFTRTDIDDIEKAFEKTPEPKIILTTEKDYMRLKSEYKILRNLYYLPIQVEIDNPIQFQKMIEDYVQKYQRSK